MAVVWHPVLPTKLPNSSTSTPPQSSAAANEGGDNGGGGGRRFTLGLYHLALDVTKLAMEEECRVGGERRGVGQGPKPPPPPPLSNASHDESKSPERHSPPSARSSLTINVSYKHARSGSQDRSSAARAAQAALSAILSVDNPSLEVKGPKGDLEEVAGSSLGQFTEPGFATGLLLMAYACENKTLRLGGLEASQGGAAGGGGTSSSSSLGLRNVRVNWKLLRDSPPSAQGAALWRSLGDWRKASCLAFTVHQLMRKVGGLGGGGGEGEAACLHMGLSILRQQVARCHAMEVQEACITLHELVAIPRHVLGHKSAVYALMMRKVSREERETHSSCRTLPLSP